jgi:type IV secretory pathway VirB10-like protein
MKKVTRNVIVGLLIVSTLFLMAFTPPIWPQSTGVMAATPKPQAGQNVNKNLALILQREENVSQRQQLHLTKASQVASKAQDLISKAQAKGVNVDDLVKALADFNAKLADAQKAHDQAVSILNAKNGFDSSGNVTDRQAAHQTLMDARDNLRQAHLSLANGVLTLRTAVLNWRIAHQKTK